MNQAEVEELEQQITAELIGRLREVLQRRMVGGREGEHRCVILNGDVQAIAADLAAAV